jgi:16S rRNA (adenine1518-N6/adenine1519-N6)-dimethyltransferase
MGLQRRAQICFPVHRSAFLPPPRVDSVVVRLDPLATPLVELGSDLHKRVHRVIDGAFSQRRKTLFNSLRGAGFADAASLLAEAGIDPGRRAETLSPAEFVTLARATGSAPLPEPLAQSPQDE